jgi:hypothetical protein
MLRKMLLCVVFSLASAAAHAQALTVLAAKAALEGALGELRAALTDATNDLRSLGNSLQANAQNVVQDVDRMLGSKMNLAFDRLDAAELRLMEDVQALTRQVQGATLQVVQRAGEEARRSIVEADIAAYNASYSLPCRSAPPRVLASFPARLVARRSSPVLQLRGNFLRQGTLSAVINGRPARILERLDTALSVEVPAEVVQAVADAEVLASVVINGLERVERAPRLWGLMGCAETRALVAEKPMALSVIEPPYQVQVEGTVRYEYTASRDVTEPEQEFSRTGSDRCDDNSRADEQWCVAGGTLAGVQVSDVRTNCNSGYEGNLPSGERCVLVRGRVAGCGAVRGPFNAWLGCKGRGWLKYKIQLVRREPFQAMSADAHIDRKADPGVWSFAFDLPSSTGLTAAQPRYNLTVRLMQGKRTVTMHALTHANPNAGPVTSRVQGGVLAVEVDASAPVERR